MPASCICHRAPAGAGLRQSPIAVLKTVQSRSPWRSRHRPAAGRRQRERRQGNRRLVSCGEYPRSSRLRLRRWRSGLWINHVLDRTMRSRVRSTRKKPEVFKWTKCMEGFVHGQVGHAKLFKQTGEPQNDVSQRWKVRGLHWRLARRSGEGFSTREWAGDRAFEMPHDGDGVPGVEGGRGSPPWFVPDRRKPSPAPPESCR